MPHFSHISYLCPNRMTNRTTAMEMCQELLHVYTVMYISTFPHHMITCCKVMGSLSPQGGSITNWMKSWCWLAVIYMLVAAIYFMLPSRVPINVVNWNLFYPSFRVPIDVAGFYCILPFRVPIEVAANYFIILSMVSIDVTGLMWLVFILFFLLEFPLI